MKFGVFVLFEDWRSYSMFDVDGNDLVERERLTTKRKMGEEPQRILLASMRMQVCSLASLGGLRIPCCHELWCRLQTQLRSCVAVAVVWAGSSSSNSTPSLGTSMCHRCGPKKKEKQTSSSPKSAFNSYIQLLATLSTP